MTLTPEEVNALFEAMRKLTDTALESAGKITAMENMLKKRPDLWNDCQYELGLLRNSAELAGTRQGLSRALSEMQHELVRPRWQNLSC
jgi:acyl-CoA reductase-like NAD-dependent aldehyde dehydrogenase